MAPRRNVPPALYALVTAVLVVLLAASAIAGQWAILVLGCVAIAALIVPFRSR